MKIVVNRCCGDFGLSDAGMAEYFRLKGWMLYQSIRDHGITRTDPELIQLVETLGDAANGPDAKLQIVEIPDGIAWEIDEYDGCERVNEAHRSW